MYLLVSFIFYLLFYIDTTCVINTINHFLIIMYVYIDKWKFLLVSVAVCTKTAFIGINITLHKLCYLEQIFMTVHII